MAARATSCWRELLDRHDEAARRLVGQEGGRLIKRTGDGVLGVFDGPGRASAASWRSERNCKAAGSRSGPGSTPVRSTSAATTWAGSRSTWPPGSWPPPAPARSWCSAPSRTWWRAPTSRWRTAGSTRSRVWATSGTSSPPAERAAGFGDRGDWYPGVAGDGPAGDNDAAAGVPGQDHVQWQVPAEVVGVVGARLAGRCAANAQEHREAGAEPAR
jgi:hypothetical protein